MALSNDDVLKQQLAVAVTQALEAQKVDDQHCLLIRFYSDLATVNSKAYQAGIAINARPSRAALAERAALHMFAGDTEGSYFISFSEDITALLKAISDSPDVSWAVRSIIMGLNPQFYGQKGKESIAKAPAQFIGIFKVNKDNVVRWNDADLVKAVQALRQKEKKYADLKMNFQHEREVVAYYPGKLEAPVATVDNPFYPVYMSKVSK